VLASREREKGLCTDWGGINSFVTEPASRIDEQIDIKTFCTGLYQALAKTETEVLSAFRFRRSPASDRFQIIRVCAKVSDHESKYAAASDENGASFAMRVIPYVRSNFQHQEHKSNIMVSQELNYARFEISTKLFSREAIPFESIPQYLLHDRILFYSLRRCY
jgi:hypothetical protein